MAKDRGELRKFAARVGFAFSGIRSAFRNERNLQIQLVIAILTFAVFLLLQVSFVEFLIMLLLIGGVISLELMNTALEHVVDLVTKDYHPLAKTAKDIAAGSVLFFSFMALISGIIIVIHHLR